MIESEDDAGLHRHAVRMKTPDDFAIFGGVVVAFVGAVKAGLRNCFQAEEERFASAPGCEEQKSSSNAASAVHWLVHQRFNGAIAANSSLA